MRPDHSIAALWVAALIGTTDLAVAGTTDVDTAAGDQRAGAQKTFEAGSKLYDSKRYEEALTAFRASYQIVASPNSHLMVARCLRDLGRNADAYREYEAVAREAQQKGARYEATARTALEERAEVKPRIALVTLRLTEPRDGVQFKRGDTVLPAESAGREMAFDPATEVFTATAPDGSTARVEVTLAPGSVQNVDLKLEAKATDETPSAEPPPPATPPPAPVAATTESGNGSLRTWAFVAGGVGAVGFGAFALLGSMSQSKFHDLESACPGHVCPEGKQGDIDSGKQLQTFANVGLALGVLGLGAGVTLFVLSSHGSGHEGEPKSVSLRLGPGSAALEGRL